MEARLGRGDFKMSIDEIIALRRAPLVDEGGGLRLSSHCLPTAEKTAAAIANPRLSGR